MTALLRKISLLLLRLIVSLPLPLVHAFGFTTGWLLYLLGGRSIRFWRKNIALSGLCQDDRAVRHLLYKNVGETGKALLETLAIWLRDKRNVMKWARQCSGWEEVEAALAAGKGIIFLTPHQGCYEITSLYYGERHPLTILYRPSRQKWLLPLIATGRTWGQVKLAPTNMRGVKELLHALRQGEAIGILPDQIPAKGEGEWAPFFGRPAYTMTLVSRLRQKTGAAVIMAFGERLSWGRGYHVHFRALPEGSVDTVEGLNQQIEQQVTLNPEQYMWNYHRYNIRSGTMPGR